MQEIKIGPLRILPFLMFILVNVYYFHPLMSQYNFYDSRRLVEMAILLLLGISLFLIPSLRSAWIQQFLNLPNLVRTLIAVFFIIGLVSASLAPLPKYAFLQVGWYGLLLISGIATACLYQRAPSSFNRTVLITLLISIGFYTVFALLSYCVGLFDHATKAASVYNFTSTSILAWPGFVNPRFLLEFMSWTLAFLPLPILLYRDKFGLSLWLYYVIAGYYWCLAIANQSRLLPLQIIVVAVLLLILYRRAVWPWFKQQLIMFATGLVMYGVLFNLLLPTPQRDLVDYQDPVRVNIWHLAIKFLTEHPLLGVGPGHYPYYAYAYEQYAAHPHNAILMIAAEWGGIALLCLLAVTLWGFWRWIKVMPQAVKTNSDPAVKFYAITLTASICMGCMDAMVSGVLVMPLSQAMIPLIMGWALGLYYSQRSLQMVPTNWLSHAIFMLIVLAAMVFVILGVWPEVTELNSFYNHYLIGCSQAGLTTCQFNPNFWLQGWIQLFY
jgi:O-antigen ligase